MTRSLQNLCFTLLAALVLLASPLLLGARASAQEEQPPAAYDPMIDSAVAEFTAGRWQEARALFLEAHALYPNARTLRGIGMTSYELRDYPEAVEALEASLAAERRPLTEEQRGQVRTLLEQAHAFIGRFVVPAAPEGSRLYVDDARVDIDESWPAAPATIVLGVGAHTVEIRGETGAVASTRILVRGRTETELDIDLSPLTPRAEPPALVAAPASVDPAPFIVLGAGLGVAVVGALLYGAGWADIGTVQTGGRDWVELVDAYNRAPILTGAGAALLGVGLGAAVVGAIWSIVLGSTSGPDSRQTVRLRIGPGSAGLEGQF
jgi:hypothetical protein